MSFTTVSAGPLDGPDFCLIFTPCGYDQPEILRSSITPICPIGADAGQDLARPASQSASPSSASGARTHGFCCSPMPSIGRPRRGPRPPSRAILEGAPRKRTQPCAIRIATGAVPAASSARPPPQARHDSGPDRRPRPRADRARAVRAALPDHRRGRSRPTLRSDGGALSGTARARRGRGAHGRLRNRQPSREP